MTIPSLRNFACSALITTGGLLSCAAVAESPGQQSQGLGRYMATIVPQEGYTLDEYNRRVEEACYVLHRDMEALARNPAFVEDRTTSRRVGAKVELRARDGANQCNFIELYERNKALTLKYYTQEKGLPYSAAERMYGSDTMKRNFVKEMQLLLAPVGVAMEQLRWSVDGQEVSPLKYSLVFFGGGAWEEQSFHYD